MSLKIKAFCPTCAYEVDDATGVGDAVELRPEPGNLAICIRCASIGIYVKQGEFLGLRPTTPEEDAQYADDEEVTKVRAVIIAREIWMKP